MHDDLRVRSAASCRNEALHVVREEQQANAVHILDRRECEHGRQLGGDVAFAPIDRSEGHRRRSVDRDDDRQIALFDELLHVRRAGARGHVPVDRADVIAGLIFANLGKLDSAALKCGVIVAGETGADQTRRKDLEVANPPGDRRLKLRLLSAKKSHGTGTAARI